jgi:hypothetical protein
VIPGVISADGHTVKFCMHEGTEHVQAIYYGGGEPLEFPEPVPVGEALRHMPPRLRRKVLDHVQSEHTRREPYGPIRPSDAIDGWGLEGDEDGWLLVKRYGPYIATVKANRSAGCHAVMSTTLSRKTTGAPGRRCVRRATTGAHSSGWWGIRCRGW